jgi:hypothetical protein
VNASIIERADELQASLSFKDIPYSDKITTAVCLLQKIRTGNSIQDILDEIDPEATLSQAAEKMLLLHADEPTDSIIGIVLAIILTSDREEAV